MRIAQGASRMSAKSSQCGTGKWCGYQKAVWCAGSDALEIRPHQVGNVHGVLLIVSASAGLVRSRRGRTVAGSRRYRAVQDGAFADGSTFIRIHMPESPWPG